MTISSFFPVLERLTQKQQETLSAAAFSRRVRRGDVIHHADADCTGLLLVQSGQLRAFILSEDGREITLYRLFERDLCLFSASCMMRSIQFDITIQAEKDTELWVIPAESYRQVMDESAPLSNFTSEVMATRFTDVMWLIEQILWKSFDRRLAAFLLEEAAIEGTNVLKITHEIIGNHMGNPREVVTRMLRYFQNEGMVCLSRGTVEIVDENALRRLTE